MSRKIKVPCKILDKKTKSSWFFGDSYFVIMRLFTHDENPSSPLSTIKERVKEWEITQEQYYLYTVGTEGFVTLYVHSDGLGYPYDETD